MAQKLIFKSCLGCIHLQKENPIISGDMALYQCTSQKRNGRCVGWVQKGSPDKGLNTQGGSCCNVLCPGDKIEQKSYYSNNSVRYLYCGRIDKHKYLLYRTNNNGYNDVGETFFRGQPGNISNRIKVVKQNPGQLEASKRMAKKRKVKWLNEYNQYI